MAIERLRVGINGTPGGNGVCTHFATPGAGHQPDFDAFWTTLAPLLGNGIQVVVPDNGDTIDEATGALTGAWTGGTPGLHAGTPSATFAGGVGACITWLTTTIRNGRRIRGRTFVVPLSTNQFDTDGTLQSSALAAINGAAQTLVTATAGDMLVWSRPVGGTGGVAAPVTGWSVTDQGAFLKSRRT